MPDPIDQYSGYTPPVDGNGNLLAIAAAPAGLAASFPGLFGQRPQPQRRPIHTDATMDFSSIVQVALNVLSNPDRAFRENRELQEQMLVDPVVLGPMRERMLSVAQLEWQIKPEDENDPQQVAQAGEIERLIRKIRRPENFFKALLWGDWRGTGVSEIMWKQEEGTNLWYPGSSRPHNGDKIVYDRVGTPRLLTRRYQVGGRELTPAERGNLVIHTFEPDDGSFYKGEEAAYVFKGRGLRDRCWPFWFLMHNSLRLWVRAIERFAGGYNKGKYPANNDAAKSAIETALLNLMSDSSVSIPVPPGAEDRETYGIESVMVPMEGAAQVFQQFVDGYCGHKLRILIKGEDSETQEHGDGLGSGRAETMRGKARAVRDDSARSLADTLSHELVEKVRQYNWGGSGPAYRFEFVLDGDDYEQAEKRCKAAREMGLTVPKSWPYETLGIPQPDGTDEVIDFAAMTQPQMGMAGQGGTLAESLGFSPDFFAGHDQTNEKTRLAFREAMREPGWN